MTRNTFTREFKIQAVRLLELNKKPSAELARELGIKRNQLYKWKEEVDSVGAVSAFPGRGGRSRKAGNEQAEENIQLKKDLAKLKEENEILKKAAAFFAREME
jgi:transposase-like protein